MDIALILGMTAQDESRDRLLTTPFPSSPWVEVAGDLIIIRAGYTDVLVRLLRWVPGARWHRGERRWTVPLAAAESVRSILPEILRLAELTADGDTPCPRPPAPDSPADATDVFRDAARLMYGADWQGQIADALGRDEVPLARWLAGETQLESGAELLTELQSLLRRRAAQFLSKADRIGRIGDALKAQ